MRINENMVSLVQDLFSIYLEALGYLKSVEGAQNCEAFSPLSAWTGLVRCLEGPNVFVKARGATNSDLEKHLDLSISVFACQFGCFWNLCTPGWFSSSCPKCCWVLVSFKASD